jgi:hypothetical protein
MERERAADDRVVEADVEAPWVVAEADEGMVVEKLVAVAVIGDLLSLVIDEVAVRPEVVCAFELLCACAHALYPLIP